jgi:hypothetical protein
MIACHTREFYWKSQDTFNCYDKMLKMGGNALSYRHCDSYAYAGWTSEGWLDENCDDLEM